MQKEGRKKEGRRELWSRYEHAYTEGLIPWAPFNTQLIKEVPWLSESMPSSPRQWHWETDGQAVMSEAMWKRSIPGGPWKTFSSASLWETTRSSWQPVSHLSALTISSHASQIFQTTAIKSFEKCIPTAYKTHRLLVICCGRPNKPVNSSFGLFYYTWN